MRCSSSTGSRRQIEVHHALAELEVAALGAGLGADRGSTIVRIAEVRDLDVARAGRHLVVEARNTRPPLGFEHARQELFETSGCRARRRASSPRPSSTPWSCSTSQRVRASRRSSSTVHAARLRVGIARGDARRQAAHIGVALDRARARELRLPRSRLPSIERSSGSRRRRPGWSSESSAIEALAIRLQRGRGQHQRVARVAHQGTDRIQRTRLGRADAPRRRPRDPFPQLGGLRLELRLFALR